MSVVNQFGKLFNRKPGAAGNAAADDGQDVLGTGSLEAAAMREYQSDAMNSVQGDPGGYAPELTEADGDEDL